MKLNLDLSTRENIEEAVAHVLTMSEFPNIIKQYQDLYKVIGDMDIETTIALAILAYAIEVKDELN